MKSIELVTEIHNGKPTRNINRYNQALEYFEGKTITVTFKVVGKERSYKQLSYYFGVIVPIWRQLIQDEWGEFLDIQETHEFLKFNCNYIEKVDMSTGEILRFSKSTKDNTTTDQEIFHTRARELAMDMFYTEIPMPSEQVKIDFDKGAEMMLLPEPKFVILDVPYEDVTHKRLEQR